MNIFEEDGHPAVIAYRIKQVEAEVSKLGGKMDTIIAMYPTESRVLSMIKPLEDDMKEMKRVKEIENQQKVSLQGQLKIAVIAAVISPIATLIITLIVTSTR